MLLANSWVILSSYLLADSKQLKAVQVLKMHTRSAFLLLSSTLQLILYQTVISMKVKLVENQGQIQNHIDPTFTFHVFTS